MTALDVDRKIMNRASLRKILLHNFACKLGVNNYVLDASGRLTDLPLDELPSDAPKLLGVIACVTVRQEARWA